MYCRSNKIRMQMTCRSFWTPCNNGCILICNNGNGSFFVRPVCLVAHHKAWSAWCTPRSSTSTTPGPRRTWGRTPCGSHKPPCVGTSTCRHLKTLRIFVGSFFASVQWPLGLACFARAIAKKTSEETL